MTKDLSTEYGKLIKEMADENYSIWEHDYMGHQVVVFILYLSNKISKLEERIKEQELK